MRDPCKLIETKQVYTGTNAAIRRNAQLHIDAMRQSASIEMPLPFVEDLFGWRQAKYGKASVDFESYARLARKVHFEVKIQPHHIDTVERAVMNKLKLYPSSLASLYESGTLALGAIPKPPSQVSRG